jgi:CheY-like chemotaxis protein
VPREKADDPCLDAHRGVCIAPRAGQFAEAFCVPAVQARLRLRFQPMFVSSQLRPLVDEGEGGAYLIHMPSALIGIAVLAVDNDPDNLDVIEHVITEFGGSVRTATDAREVVEILRTWRPDVMLLDIAMPEVDGYDLLDAIRRDATLRAIPAVAVTGHAFDHDKRRAVDAGFARHVTKPVDIDVLIRVIAELVPAPTRTGPNEPRSAAMPCCRPT